MKKYAPPPEYKIAVGDTVSVVIWEAAANGLFGESLAEWSVPSGVASRLFGTPATGAGTLLSTGESVTAFASNDVTRLLGLPEGPDQTGFAAPGARAAPPGATPAGGGAAMGLATAGAAQGLAGLAGQELGGAALIQNRPQTPGGALPTTLPLNPLTTPTMTSRNVEELLQQATSSGRPGTRLPAIADRIKHHRKSRPVKGGETSAAARGMGAYAQRGGAAQRGVIISMMALRYSVIG